MARKDTVCGRMPLWKWLLLLIFGSIVFLFVYGMAQGIGFLSDGAVVRVIVALIGATALLGAYYAWIRLLEGRKVVYEMTPRRMLPDTLRGMAVGFGLFCAITAVLAVSGMYKAGSWGASWSGMIGAFAMFLVVAVGEEVIFRGFIFRMIDERYNTWAALLVSALLFGFVHISNPAATVWSSVAIAIEAGLMLGLAYKYSGNLWMPIGIHWAWNFTQGNVFGFEVSGTPAGESLISPIVSGPEFLTGGSFGPEASIIAAGLGLLISLAFFRASRRENVTENS